MELLLNQSGRNFWKFFEQKFDYWKVYEVSGAPDYGVVTHPKPVLGGFNNLLMSLRF